MDPQDVAVSVAGAAVVVTAATSFGWPAGNGRGCEERSLVRCGETEVGG